MVFALVQLYWIYYYTLSTVAGGNAPDPNITSQISFEYYYAGQSSNYINYTYSSGIDILNDERFNPRLQTIFFLPGFSETPSTMNKLQSVHYIVNAFGQYGYVNLIIINYESLVKSTTNWNIIRLWYDYLKATDNVPKIGRALGYFLQSFIPQCNQQNTNCEYNIHLIGFSIGAHIIHYIAEVLGTQQLKRVTAIDPAGPGFTNNNILDKNDAVFLDVIHTDTKLFGLSNSIGTVDFYPNGGVNQPVCNSPSRFHFNLVTWMTCDHFMGMVYYALSIQNPQAFPSQRCKDFSVPCNDTTTVYMGYGVDLNATGDFYTLTGDTPAYGET